MAHIKLTIDNEEISSWDVPTEALTMEEIEALEESIFNALEHLLG